MRDLELMVKDYRLTTAEILYHLPEPPKPPPDLCLAKS